MISWEARKKVCRFEDFGNLPKLPEAFVSRWDELYLGDAQGGQDPWRLKQLKNKSPAGSETWSVARDRIWALLEPRIATVQTLEELKQFALYSWEVGSAVQNKEAELRRARTVEAVARSDEKRVLIGAFHELKEGDPEIARQALIKLARHFPAEEVDVIPEGIAL